MKARSFRDGKRVALALSAPFREIEITRRTVPSPTSRRRPDPTRGTAVTRYRFPNRK